MTEIEVEVIVVGAGPTGLMLAEELSTAGVSTAVLDKAATGTKAPRAGAVQPRTTELLDLRGLLAPLRERHFSRAYAHGHFAGLAVDYSGLAPAGPLLHLEQQHIESFLENRLIERGVPVLRSHEVVAVEPDEAGVSATANTPQGPRRLRGRYLVAADGGHSGVRRLLGVGFPGRAGSGTAVVADIRVEVAEHPMLLDPAAQFGRSVRDESGSWAMTFQLDEGWVRLITSIAGSPGREVAVTDAEVEQGLRALFGPEVRLLATRNVSRIDDAARQVECYRHGRVLFAGDAAHIHLPFGGQGMNLGIQDAVNLGWKLAATLRGQVGEQLLDSYHAERHPVAAAVLKNVRSQGVIGNFGASGDTDLPVLRELFADLAQLPEVNRFLAGMVSGVDIRYPMPGTHPSTGARVHPIRLDPRRGVLLSASGSAHAELLAGHEERVEQRSFELPNAAVALVRPDGYVCWASDDERDATGLAEALDRWFGVTELAARPAALTG